MVQPFIGSTCSTGSCVEQKQVCGADPALAGIQERVVVLLASKASHKQKDIQSPESHVRGFAREGCLVASTAWGMQKKD